MSTLALNPLLEKVDMATRERFSRKDLKQPDEFVSTTEQVIGYCRKNQGLLLSVIIGILLIIGIVSFTSHNRGKQELRMENLLAEMKNVKEGGVDEGSVTGKLKTSLDQFDEGVHKQRARLLLAETFYQERQFGEAVNTYNEILKNSQSGDFFHKLAQTGLGYSYESAKDYKKAVETYKTIIDRGESVSSFDIYLSLARTYELDQDPKNALLILREMENKFQKNRQLHKVRASIKRLEG